MNETGSLITQLRKEKNLTQKELADTLGVTDKAVSKWETGKSYPDVALLPKLTSALGVSVDVLLANEKNFKEVERNAMKEKINKMLPLICNAVALAMGVALIVLNILDALTWKAGATFAGIAIFCLALSALQSAQKKD